MADLSKTAANERLERVKAQLRSLRERASEKGDQLMDTGVAVVTGGGLGYLDYWAAHREGASGPALLGNVDNALVVGGLATAGSFFGVGGDAMSRRMKQVGDTAFGIYSYKWAYQAMADRAAGRAAGGARETPAQDSSGAAGDGDRARGVTG